MTATDPAGQQYELLDEIGRGGFSEVYLARMVTPEGIERQVAIKKLKTGLDPQDQAFERLCDEAKLLSSLQHPALLSVYELAQIDGCAALVSEFVEGWDLSRCMAGEEPIPTRALLEVIGQVASALDASWSQLGVVHRDIKPSNIRVGIQGDVKLLDFGIARSQRSERAASTGAHHIVGTTRYLAPERFDLTRDPQPSSDVFSLGCVLYRGVTGVAFFDSPRLLDVAEICTDRQHFQRHLAQRLSLLEPSPLCGLLASMLCYEATARPTAREVSEQCERLEVQRREEPPLAQWCRARWQQAEVTGSLSAEAPVHREPRSRTMAWVAAGTLLSGGLLAVLSLLLVSAVLAAVFVFNGQ